MQISKRAFKVWGVTLNLSRAKLQSSFLICRVFIKKITKNLKKITFSYNKKRFCEVDFTK